MIRNLLIFFTLISLSFCINYQKLFDEANNLFLKENYKKSIELYELIIENNTRSELTNAAHERFKEAKERYGNNAGEMTVCKLIEEDGKVNLQVDGDWIAPWEVKHPSDK